MKRSGSSGCGFMNSYHRYDPHHYQILNMIAIQLTYPGGKPSGVWVCSECRLIHATEDLATKCCRVRTCDSCGTVLQSRYKVKCDGCFRVELSRKDRELFEKAEKIREADGTGMLYSEYPIEGYYESSDDLMVACDESGEERPRYAWVCNKRHFVKVDWDRILEDIFENGFEDVDEDDLAGVEDFRKAIDAFEAANRETYVWEPDYKRAVDFSV